MPSWYARFWRGPDVSAVQLVRFRLVFFALLAIDAFLLIAHAPRYGAGGFNVGHIPLLDAITPTPTRGAIVVGALVMVYLAARVAVGVSTRLAVPVLAVIYGAIYFSSQLDSYQHHYLLALMLVAGCFVDWRGKRDNGWVLRLLFLQVSVLYLFAAISKMETGWSNGQALAVMLERSDPSWAKTAVSWVGTSAAARATILTELALAVLIHIRVTRVPAAIIGIGFHIGIESAGFEIGLFSYYMIAFYLLVLPPVVFRWAALSPAFVEGLRARFGRGPQPLWMLGSLILAAVAVAATPLEGAYAAAVVVSLFGLVAFVLARRRDVAAAHLVAALAIVACSLATDAVRDHYRYWGGSARRLGDLPTAARAYERLVSIEPGYAAGRRNLGRVYRMQKRFDDALVQYRAATTTEPDSVSGNLGLAQSYAGLGRSAEAVKAAVRARKLAEDSPASAAMRRAADQARQIESRGRGKL